MAALAAATLLAPTAAAVPPLSVPFGDRAPRIDPERDAVRAAALGAPDERLHRLSAVRSRARSVAERRARASIHRWVDDALAGAGAMPWHARDAHRAVSREASLVGLRPLVDGGAVALVEVPVEALRRAAPIPGVPWAR